MVKSFIRYCVGGSLIYWLQIFFAATLIELSDLDYHYALLIALISGWFLTYYYHKYVTFGSNSKSKKTALYFMLVMISIYVGWYGLSFILERYTSIHYFIITIISSIPFSLAGFFINKYYVFKK